MPHTASGKAVFVAAALYEPYSSCGIIFINDTLYSMPHRICLAALQSQAERRPNGRQSAPSFRSTMPDHLNENSISK